MKNEVIEEKIDSVQKEDAKDGEKHTYLLILLLRKCTLVLSREMTIFL